MRLTFEKIEIKNRPLSSGTEVDGYHNKLTERKNEAWYLFSRFVDDSEKENFRKIIEKAINGDDKAYQKLSETIKIALEKISKLDIRKDGVNVVMTYDSPHEQYLLDVDKFIINTKSKFDAYYGYIKEGFEEILNNKEYLAPTLNMTKGINAELLRDLRHIESDLMDLCALLRKISQFNPDVQFEIEYLKEDIPRFKKNIESDPSLYSLMKPEYIDRLCHFLCKESKMAEDLLCVNTIVVNWKDYIEELEMRGYCYSNPMPTCSLVKRLSARINHKKFEEHNNLLAKLYGILNNKFESRCWEINNKITFVNSKSRTPLEDKYLTSKDSSKVLRRAILRLVYLKGEYEKLNELRDYMYQETESLIKYILATYKEKAYHKNGSIDTLFAYFNYIHFLCHLTAQPGPDKQHFSKECRQSLSDLWCDYLEYYNLDQSVTQREFYEQSPYNPKKRQLRGILGYIS